MVHIAFSFMAFIFTIVLLNIIFKEHESPLDYMIGTVLVIIYAVPVIVLYQFL